MPSFNQSEFVERAIESVLAQTGAEVEIIFVDGGSTDDTMAKVERYRDRIAHIISEPDEGQSDALAKGFALATGRFLTWLNTDDLLLPGAVSDLARCSAQNPQCEWFLGNSLWIDVDDRILHARRGEAYRHLGPRTGLLTAAGPSAFFSRKAYEAVGGINKALHYTMDTELWWRFVLAGLPYGRLQHYTWALRLHPGAKVSSNMFLDREDPKAAAAARAQALEAAHIEALKAPAQLGIGQFGRKIASKAQRVMSLNLWRSVLEARRWKGQTVESVFGSGQLG